MPPTFLFLGGNGHCAARLAPARAALAHSGPPPWALADVAYPGFEDRTRASNWAEFRDAVTAQILLTAGRGLVMLYGTGIGGTVALAVRAQGVATDVPLILQAPILWGLERRVFPRLMRLPFLARLLPPVFALPPFQKRFARKYFTRPPDEALRTAFFEGYARCAALPDFFRWLTPDLLGEMEANLAAHPEWFGNVTVWWGGRDHVVGPNELRGRGRTLGAGWPVRTFPEWGHYPMLDDPAGWVGALTEEIARA